jgi:hypothetical protein
MPRFGLGFRTPHFADLLAAPSAVDWLEVLSDSYLLASGARRARLERLRDQFPLALHGVGLNLASDTGPRPEYLAQLRALADRVEPDFVSDHLCWTGVGGVESHDLLPIAYTREVLEFVVERVSRVQEALHRRLLLENATAYVAFRADEMGEADFLRELCTRTGCGMLLDVNNLFVNARNLGTDPQSYLDALAAGSVAYLHVAGHHPLPELSIDTHAAAVAAPVWALFAEAMRRFPHADVILERDDAIPSFQELAGELDVARAQWRAACAQPDVQDVPAPVRAASPAAAPRAAATPAAPWPSLRGDFWARLIQKPANFDHTGRPGLDALLDGARPLAAARGMRVYSDAYGEAARLALATHFPTLARALGPAAFAALAAAYLAAHPSRSHDYVAFGAALPDFVRTFPLGVALDVAPEAFAELAALEQAQLEAQEAGDDGPALSAGALGALAPADWPRLRVRLAASHRLLQSSHDVYPALQAVARGARPPLPKGGAVAYLVTRQPGGPRTDRLEPRAGAILAALAGGASFSAACGDDADAGAGAAALALAAARGAVLELSVTADGEATSEGRPSGGVTSCPTSPRSPIAAAS